MACISKAPSSAEYKRLQLRQYIYFSGEALNLGHSEEGYTLAKERLKRNCGGMRLQKAMYLEELNFSGHEFRKCKTTRKMFRHS